MAAIGEGAVEHAGGLLGDDTYLTRLKVFRDQRDAIVERVAQGLPVTARSSGSAPSASHSRPQT